MHSSERVTWETCPSCGRSAAVGWRDRAPVHADCSGGCRLDPRTFTRRAPAVGNIPATVARWTTVINGST